jgi:hypothetical protein
MVSIMPSLVALFSGAKTLGWDTKKNCLKGILKKIPWEGSSLPSVSF